MTRLLPASLTGRLIATTVALVAVVSLLVAVVATLVIRSYLTTQLDNQVMAALDRGAVVIQGEPDAQQGNGRPGAQRPPPEIRGNREGSITALFGDAGNGSGRSITATGDLKALSAVQLAALDDVKPGKDPATVALPGLGSFRVAATTTRGGGSSVQGIPTSEVDDTIRTLVWLEANLGIAGVAIAAVAGRVLVRRQLKPLRKVATTANEVSAMPLSTGAVGTTVRVPADLTNPTTEVGQVGEALNKLLEHMEDALDARHESEQQARTFLADASHELRTPLSTIKGYAELSRRTGQTDSSEILAKVESEAGRMSSLVEDMLLLARLDAGRELERHDVDLTRLVVEAVDDARVVDPATTVVI